MLEQIRGIQHKAPKAGSDKGYSDHDDWSNCEEFVVKKWSLPQTVSIELFFPRFEKPNEGVGLEMPSVEVATAVGRALLMVAEGNADEVIVRF